MQTVGKQDLDVNCCWFHGNCSASCCLNSMEDNMVYLYEVWVLYQLLKWLAVRMESKHCFKLWQLPLSFSSYFVTFILVCWHFLFIFLSKLAMVQHKNIPVRMSLVVIASKCDKNSPISHTFFLTHCSIALLVMWLSKIQFLALF